MPVSKVLYRSKCTGRRDNPGFSGYQSQTGIGFQNQKKRTGKNRLLDNREAGLPDQGGLLFEHDLDDCRHNLEQDGGAITDLVPVY